MQEENTKELKMSFKDYYKSLSELQGDLKNRVMERLAISDKTFYNRMNEDSWSPIEIEAIHKIQADMARELSQLC